MRIVFCAYDRPGYLAGGPNTWLRRLLPDLRGRGFEVHPLVIHSGEASECPLIAFLEAEGFPVAALSRQQSPCVEGQVKWLLREARRIRPSVFVANLVCPAFYATPWLRRAGIPVVGVFHSDEPHCRVMSRHFVSGEKNRAFDAAVGVSKLLENVLASENLYGVKIARIPCGSPMPTVGMDSRDTVDPERKLRLLYLGRIADRQKRISDLALALIKATISIPCIEASVYGGGPEEEKLRTILADEMAREPHGVTFHGAVHPDRVYEIYREHDIFVLLSDYEGLPIALIEAMAAGLVPVCLAEESGVAEVLQDGVNGLVVADRGDSFVEAIRRLHEDRRLLARLAREARATVEREYSSEINHGRWADLLRELGGEASPGTVRVPLLLKLPPPEPAFGSEDLRRPPLRQRVRSGLSQAWLRLRLTVRPRARIREWLGIPSRR